MRSRITGWMLAGMAAAVMGCQAEDETAYHTYDPAVDEAPAARQSDPAAQAAATQTTDLRAARVAPQPTSADVPPAPADQLTPADSAAEITKRAIASRERAQFELIRARLKAQGLTLPDVGEYVPLEPRETKLLIPEKEFNRTKDGVLRVSYDDLDLLKVLNMEPVPLNAPDYFPQWLKDLEGKKVRLRGYMRPDTQSEGIQVFILARDTEACCFGPNTRSYDVIPTLLREGETTEYIHFTPFDVVGTFHINVEPNVDDPTQVEYLYLIDDAVVIQN